MIELKIVTKGKTQIHNKISLFNFVSNVEYMVNVSVQCIPFQKHNADTKKNNNKNIDFFLHQ